MKTLLVISGGVEAADVARRAREMGLNVVVSDRDPGAPGFAVAHHKLMADVYSAEDTARAAEEFHRTVRPIDGVICAAADAPLSAALVGERLGLSGITMESARLASDKLAMKERFAADRLRVWELDEILALVPSARRPVGSFEYTDTNFNLLGLVIEHVRQQPLVEVLRNGVLRVEGTKRLIWQPDEEPTDPMAMPLGESRDALEQGGGYLPSRSDTIDGAAGGMASDSISLARWWQAFCAGEIVSETSLTEMSTLIGDVDDEYGLGLFNPAAGYAQGVGHMGANFGYSSWSACLPQDQMIVVVLRNFEDDGIFELGRPLVMAARPE